MRSSVTLYLLTLLLFFSVGFSQAQQYTVSQIPYTPLPYTGGINIVTNTDDLWSSPIGIGFDFYFFGQPYQYLIAGTNSLVTFDSSQAGKFCPWDLSNSSPLPTQTVSMNSIMFPYQDVDVSIGGVINHQVYGTPPNRKFVISFNNTPYYDSQTMGSCSGTSPFTGQLVLHETTNVIEMFIENKDSCSGWNSGLAIMGIQNIGGTEAYTVPGRNRTVWEATSEGWRFSPDSSLPNNLNRISGRVFVDSDNDCSFGGNDNGLKNKPVIFHETNSNNYTYTYTDMLGYYSKLVDTGSYVFTTSNISSQFYNSSCPSNGSYSVTFNNYNDSSDNNLFADTISQFCSAIIPGIFVFGEPSSPLNIGVCDTAQIRVSCCNQGVTTDTAFVQLNLNDSTSILYSPVPYTSLGNNHYAFNFGLLSPGEDTSIVLLVNIGCDTIGTYYCSSVQTTPTFSVPCFVNGNSQSACFFIGVPYDPNTIHVSSALHPQLGMVDYLETQGNDQFNYTIVFQNTGTAVAHNVKLEIPLSEKVLLSSLITSTASAPYSWLVLDSTLTVDFTNIELPDSGSDYMGSIGYFTYRVDQHPDNSTNDLILHHASIYFDYNSPIVTNNAIVKLVDSVATYIPMLDDIDLLLYPNPALQSVELITASPSAVRVADITGKLMTSLTTTSTKTLLEISNWSKGVYFVSVSSKGTVKTVRLVKE